MTSSHQSSNAIKVVKLGDDNLLLAKVDRNLPEGDYKILVSIQPIEERAVATMEPAAANVEAAESIEACCDGLKVKF
ncbi:hypothetical protein [Nostoc sp. CALU 1950]|uniref:hypothetical protein n=1 Tax=Nostoc sp. CALU 1950 TaxID=3104321 RepID=UPI003EBDAE75